MTATLIYSHNDNLFGKPVTINVSATELFSSDFSRRKFAGTGLVLFTLKRTTDMSLSVGGVFILDPSANIPFTPFISYWRKIKSLDADLFVDIPSRIALRKEFKKKYSVTAFTELELFGTQSFFNLQAPLPEKSIYSTLDLKTGVLLEYQFSKKAVFSISGGAFKYLSSKMAEQGKKINDDYFITNKTALVPYINIGVSLLPFWKGRR